MQLNPRLPPRRADRKALRYASEVHRLRAEGHTMESIRLASLGMGASVSLRTVSRELARPSSTWELVRGHDAPLAPEDPQQAPGEISAMAPSPAPLGANSDESHGTASGPPTTVAIGALVDSRNVGPLSKMLEVLRKLHRARWRL